MTLQELHTCNFIVRGLSVDVALAIFSVFRPDIVQPIKCAKTTFITNGVVIIAPLASLCPGLTIAVADSPVMFVYR